MHFPLSAHPISMAPMPSLCSGSSLCTPSTPSFAGAALNMTASFTVSGLLWNALLFSISFSSHHFLLFILVYHVEPQLLIDLLILLELLRICSRKIMQNMLDVLCRITYKSKNLKQHTQLLGILINNLWYSPLIEYYVVITMMVIKTSEQQE